MGLFKKKPKKPKKVKITKKQKFLMLEFEKGKILQVNNNIDNEKHFRKINEAENV